MNMFLAVDDPLIPVADGAGAGGPGVGPGIWFRQPEGADLFAAHQRRQVFLLLRLRAEQVDRLAAQRGVGIQDDGNRAGNSRNLFQGNQQAEIVAACAAIRLRKRDPQQPQFGHPLEDVGGKLVGGIDLFGARGNFLFREFPHRVLDQHMFVGQLEIHVAPPLAMSYEL